MITEGITLQDLPEDGKGIAVFDLEDGETIKVCVTFTGTFYGEADSFDVETSTAQEMVDKLNGWEATLVGWE